MALSGLRLGRAAPAALERLLADAQRADLSYDHPGSTVDGPTPPGIEERTFRRSTRGGLDDAVRALRCWRPHDGIRAHIHPADAPLEVGSTLLVAAPFGPLQLVVPDRIVRVVDGPGQFGFAYGTVATHAEAGEELFLAEAHDDDHLELTIRVHARPASTLARAGSPVVSLLQGLAARRYLAAWDRAITSGSG